MTEEQEMELIAKLKDSSTKRDAFSRLVKEYSEMLYWQIRKIVLSHEDANDVLQDAFIKIWKNIDNFRGDSKLSTWLYRIVTNEGITHLNKMRAQQGTSMDDEDTFLYEKLESDTYFDGDAAQLKLQKAILTLPEKQRLVFNMKYFDDMKYKDISDILETSVGALKASYFHAVKKIENYLISTVD